MEMEERMSKITTTTTIFIHYEGIRLAKTTPCEKIDKTLMVKK